MEVPYVTAGILACHLGQAGGRYPHTRTAHEGVWLSPSVSRSALTATLGHHDGAVLAYGKT